MRQRILRWLSSLMGSRGTAQELEEAREQLAQRSAELDEQIRARERAEEENARWADRLEVSRRLESLGLLAGGVAHDFRNILVGIQGNAELILTEVEEASRVGELARSLLNAAERASELTRQLHGYAGNAQMNLEPIQPARLIEETIDLIRNGVARGVVFEHASEGVDIWTEADPTQLGQVILNLLVNAAEAATGDGSVVRLRTRTVAASRSYLAQFHGGRKLPEGIYGCVEVSDDGCGMTQDVLARVFEPFYTTKADGRGLGLATTLEIVSAHGGALSAESIPGQGTTFRILLPTCAPPSESDAPA